jgi:hypothetical protein
MKLLNTIQQLINEAEDNLYNASLTSDSIEEIKVLERKLEETMNLLNIYKSE